MRTGSELAETILDIVQEPSLDEDAILVKLNEFAIDVAGRVLFPALEAEGTVNTVTTGASVSLPVNFHRNLFACNDPRGSITVLNSKAQLMLRNGTDLSLKQTRTASVAAAKPLLWYAPIPIEATALTLFYHRKPDAVTASAGLTFLPDDSYEVMAINWVCWKLYEKIEQGMEGAKVDTGYYSALYLGMLEELRNALPQGVSMPPPPIATPERW